MSSLFQDDDANAFGGAGTEPTPSTSGVRTGGAGRQPAPSARTAPLSNLPSSGPANEGRAGMSIVDAMMLQTASSSGDDGGRSAVGSESDYGGRDSGDVNDEGGSGPHSTPGDSSTSSTSSVERQSPSSADSGSSSESRRETGSSDDEGENDSLKEFLEHLR